MLTILILFTSCRSVSGEAQAISVPYRLCNPGRCGAQTGNSRSRAHKPGKTKPHRKTRLTPFKSKHAVTAYGRNISALWNKNRTGSLSMSTVLTSLVAASLATGGDGPCWQSLQESDEP